MSYTLAFSGKGERDQFQCSLQWRRRVLVKPPVEEDSPITDLDEIASSKDSDEPGTTCKKEALVEVDDDLVDSDKETLIFNQ